MARTDDTRSVADLIYETPPPTQKTQKKEKKAKHQASTLEDIVEAQGRNEGRDPKEIFDEMVKAGEGKKGEEMDSLIEEVKFVSDVDVQFLKTLISQKNDIFQRIGQIEVEKSQLVAHAHSMDTDIQNFFAQLAQKYNVDSQEFTINLETGEIRKNEKNF